MIKNWLFDNHKKMATKIGYLDQWTYKIYKFWLENFNFKVHNELIGRLKKFIDSDEFRLRTTKY